MSVIKQSWITKKILKLLELTYIIDCVLTKIILFFLFDTIINTINK